MKKLIVLLALCPLSIFGNDIKIPSKIKEVTVYLSGARITRSASCVLKAGTSEVVFNGLSTKIDESSIQVSGLRAVSILSMAYDINYLSKPESNPEVLRWESEIDGLESKIALLKNRITGLEEEEKVISANRSIGSGTQALNLEKMKEISTYYRERITAIRDAVFKTNMEINTLNEDVLKLTDQLAETNNAPERQQGEIKIKFDAPIATTLNLSLSYTVRNAGWIPTYDIRSAKLNDPLKLAYKAHVYQKTGNDWNDVKVILSTGNPNVNVAKPNLGAKYLNFVSRYQNRHGSHATKKQKYAYNPTVKKVIGTITDSSGEPLPGCNVVVKGTTTGTQTDFDGHFSLDIGEGKELVFSYIGFKTEQLPIYSSVMNVGLEEDMQMLEEVVVTGYGSTSSGLQGRTGGVSVRGTSSMAKPKSPLYVIDGIPMNDFVEGDLDENEIQSIEVLKDRGTTAIYGNRGSNGVVVITTKKSTLMDDFTNAKFVIKKSYSIVSDGDITAIEINSFQLATDYEYFTAPIINENVFLTASFKEWEQYNLLPGEANIYFEGGYAGKTTIDPYTVAKEMVISLGIDPNITVIRKQDKNFKSKSLTGGSRILDRVYELEVKNNKTSAVNIKLMDRIPLSQNKEIKVSDIETFNADYDLKKGLLTWKMKIAGKGSKKETFSFKVKYPRYRTISL